MNFCGKIELLCVCIKYCLSWPSKIKYFLLKMVQKYVCPGNNIKMLNAISGSACHKKYWSGALSKLTS